MTKTILTENIARIEDLDVKRFIATVRNIKTMQATEKLDGSRMWLGMDTDGRLYTTRANNTAPSGRFYSETDYPYFASNNGLRAAHLALEKKEKEIASILSPNETIELEILYGRQPNAVTYGLDGKNFIAFVRGVNGTSDLKAEQLTGVLENQEVSVKTIVVDTEDGINLDRKTVTQKFRFVGLQKIKPEALSDLNFEKELKRLESFLGKDSGIQGLTNFDLIGISLGSIPKEDRPAAKATKETVISTIKNDYKLPIKKQLLSKIVSKVKPSLRDAEVTGDEDIDLEGVVLKDPETGELISVLDQDSFNTVNAFNSAIRDQVIGSVRTTDDTASLEARGGIVGQMKIRIADLLGNKNLALTREAKKIFDENRGANPTETLNKVSKILDGAHDFLGTKRKIKAVIAATVDELTSMLEKFKKNKDDPDNTYRLKLRNGKTIGLSQEVLNRTLLTFAEAKRNLLELHQNVDQASTFNHLVAVLYARAAKAVHADQEITESLNEEAPMLLEVRNYTAVARYKEPIDAWTVLNIYVGTVMMAVLMYKADDKRGIRLVKDKPHYRMTKHTPEMSALNFWGYPVWRAEKAAVAKLLRTKKIATDLNRITKKVPNLWVKFLHMDLSFGKDLDIDWEKHYKTMRFLIQHAPGLSMNRINTLLEGAFNYDTLTYDEKVKFLPKLYFFVMQFVPTSPLITRVRAIQNDLLGSEKETPIVMTKGQKLLGEDGEIAPGPGAGEAPASPSSASSSSAPGTQSSDVSSVEMRLGRHPQIIRRKRNPNVKKKRFERPKKEST